MADFGQHLTDFTARGLNLAALSVDSPERSEPLRSQLDLRFPLLCDTRREVVRAWGVYNPREAGGIAQPAIYLIDTQGRITRRSLDSTWKRPMAADLLAALDGSADSVRRTVWPRPRDARRAFGNWLRRGRVSKPD